MAAFSVSSSASPAEPTLNRLELFVLFVASRLIMYAVAGLGLLGIQKPANFLPPQHLSDWFLRWDALWYLDVMEHGYHFTRLGEPTNVGYFPLYPYLVRALSLDGLINLRFVAYTVSLIGLWVACEWLWRLVAREWRDAHLATLAVTFLLFSPVTFFFSALYSESCFLPLTIGCWWAARGRRWWLAGLLGALAALTRVVGVALIVPLAWEYIVAARAEGRRWPKIVRTLPACALPLLGLAGYALIMWVKFGNPFMYSQAQLESGRHFTWFWGLFARESFTGLSLFYQVIFAGTVVIAFGLLAAGVLLRMPSSFAVYVLTFAFIYLSARFVDSLPRYFGVLFPLYVAPALIARRWPRIALPLLASSIALEALTIILFVDGYWFT